MWPSLSLSACFIFFLYPIIALSETYAVSMNSSGYTCQIDQECLDYLDNVFLNKEDSRGIYQYCQATYDNIKLCCAEPSQCQEDWGQDYVQNLRDNILNEVQNSGGGLLSCELNRLSGLIRSYQLFFKHSIRYL